MLEFFQDSLWWDFNLLLSAPFPISFCMLLLTYLWLLVYFCHLLCYQIVWSNQVIGLHGITKTWTQLKQLSTHVRMEELATGDLLKIQAWSEDSSVQAFQWLSMPLRKSEFLQWPVRSNSIPPLVPLRLHFSLLSFFHSTCRSLLLPWIPQARACLRMLANCCPLGLTCPVPR